MSVISVARSRMATLGRHVHHTLALSENILFLNVEVHPPVVSGYAIQMDVRHEEKSIDFVTEAMCPNEKRNIYLRHKRIMREMYPEYMITERHT